MTALPAAAKLVNAAVITPDGDPGFADGCSQSAKSLDATSQGVGVQVQYSGFTPGVHQDALVVIADSTSSTVVGEIDTNSQWPFKFDAAGCVTANVPLQSPLVATDSYTARIFIGPSYDTSGSVRFDFGSNNNNQNNQHNQNNNNNNVAPPG